MTDLRGPLQRKFDGRDRFANFGEVLTKLTVNGFRGHASTTIEIRSPITALCGLNGCGKSTIVELAAAAYRAPAGTPFQISTFFAVGPLDPAPFDAQASVQFEYWQQNQSVKTVTLSRTPQSNWSGYRRRPERHVEFISADIHVPRVERRDFVVREASRLLIDATTPLAEVQARAQNVLGQTYTTVEQKDVRKGRTRAEVLSASRAGVSYSEIHMGCGEGRVQSMIRRLEAAPEKSLIVLEEPESALHQSAQYRLGQYLVELALRKGHQILLTTHSDFVLRALPQMSSVYLHRTATGLQPIAGIPSMQAVSLLSEGNAPALTVVVEDDCAQAIMSELIRSIDATFLTSVRIVVAGKRDKNGQTVGGGKDEIKTAMNTLASAGLRVAAVLDGDGTANPATNLFKLPGTRAPEKEMMDVPEVVAFLRATYGVVWADFLAGMGANPNHHEYLPKLATHARVTVEQLTGELAREYATRVNANDARALVDQLKDAATR
ncbi:MAG: ATP-dependent nuclease [Phycisphaerales bacterium]